MTTSSLSWPAVSWDWGHMSTCQHEKVFLDGTNEISLHDISSHNIVNIIMIICNLYLEKCTTNLTLLIPGKDLYGSKISIQLYKIIAYSGRA